MAKRPLPDEDGFDADDEWRDDDAFEGADADENESDESESEGEEDDGVAYCPECGASIHDSADICTKCFTWIDGAARRPPRAERARARRNALIAWILIGAILAGAGLFLLIVRR